MPFNARIPFASGREMLLSRKLTLQAESASGAVDHLDLLAGRGFPTVIKQCDSDVPTFRRSVLLSSYSCRTA